MSDKKVGVGVGVMIMRDNKVLLGLRHQDEEKADSVFNAVDTWTMPGGKLDYGEDPEETAAREVFEETGLKVESIKLIAVNSDKNEHAHFVTFGFFADKVSGEPQVLEPDEITEWKWFNLNNLPENIYFPSAHVLENYKKGEFYIKRK